MNRLPSSAHRQVAAGLLALALCAGPRAAAANSADADAAWQALQQLLAPLPVSSSPNSGSSPTQRVAQEISQFHRAALKANAFYLKYPGDSRAATARKLEAVAALQSVQLGGVQYAPTANALGAAFRTNPSNATADRFDVALAMETLSLPTSLQGKPLAQNGPAYQALADKLHAEFGEVPQVYNLYVSIMRSADRATAQTVAGSVLQMSGAPDWAKSFAQQNTSRAGFVGKPLSGNLTTTAGGNLNLAPPSGQVTVVYFWTPDASGADLAALKGLPSSLPSNLRWVYVSLGGTGSAPNLIVPFAGTFCTESQGFASANAQSLSVTETPYVFVLTPQGKVAGSGHVQDLPALVQAAAQ